MEEGRGGGLGIRRLRWRYGGGVSGGMRVTVTGEKWEGGLPGEDVVCDSCDAVLVSESEAEFEH